MLIANVISFILTIVGVPGDMDLIPATNHDVAKIVGVAQLRLATVMQLLPRYSSVNHVQSSWTPDYSEVTDGDCWLLSPVVKQLIGKGVNRHWFI